MKNPFGLHTITPYLVVEDVQRLIDFLQNVFMIELRGEIQFRKDGSVQHAELKMGDSVLMMGEPHSDLDDAQLTKFGLYVYVEDCDQTYNKAIESGAVSVIAPADYPHGDRYGGIKDFAGNTWWIVTHLGQKNKKLS